MEQYVVINIEKTQTISAVLERHILRVDVRYENGKKIIKTWTPDNADASKALLNRELVSRVYVDPDTGQTKMRTIAQAIRHRIEEAGIKKLRPGQNTALEIILTGSPETLNSLDEKGLEKWVNESMDWAGKTWGKENIVTAVLHRDEKTPHIHLIVVPIVQGLSRRSKARDEMLRRVGKKVKTKNRNTTGNRLSANEVYTQPRLYAYHTSYAKEVGAHFGLKRGVRGEKGSRKNPQKSIDYNRELERQKLETESLIAEMRSEYSEKQGKLQTVTESLAIAQGNLQKINDDTATAQENLQKVYDETVIAQANLQLIDADIARKEEKRKKAKREADEEDARLQQKKRLTADEQKKYEVLQENESTLKGAIMQMEEKLEKGRDLEGQIAEREDYFHSLGSKSLLELVSKIPELIKQDLTTMVNKYYKGRVASFSEKEIQSKDGNKLMFLEMDFRLEQDGRSLDLAVREKDGRAFLNKKFLNYKSGDPVFMKEIADYWTRTLLPEAKELVASLYKRPEQAPVAQDPVVDILKKRYGEIAVNTVAPLKTNGKLTGRMIHFTVDGKKRTAVFDVDSKEISISTGHVKRGTFHLESWKTIDGKLAVGVSNRVYSHEYRRLHIGYGVG